MCQINESNIYYLRIVEVTPLCINGVWRKIWPECVHREHAGVVDETSAVCREISNLAKESNFEGMEETDINELMSFHNQELTNEELLSQLEFQSTDEQDDSDHEMISAEQSLSCKDISKVMSLFDEGLDILMIFFKTAISF